MKNYHITTKRTTGRKQTEHRRKCRTYRRRLAKSLTYRRHAAAVRAAGTLDGNAMQHMARIAAASMLKKLDGVKNGSGVKRDKGGREITPTTSTKAIRSMRDELLRDIAIIDNGISDDTVSDTYDLVQGAALEMMERGKIAGKTMRSTAHARTVYDHYTNATAAARAAATAAANAAADRAAVLTAAAVRAAADARAAYAAYTAAAGDWMQAPLTYTEPSRRVICQGITERAAVPMVEVQRAPIRDVYRRISADTAHSRAVTAASGKYIYLDNPDLPDTYIRLLSYTMPNVDGTADINTVEAIREYVNYLELSENELKLLEYRMKGYGATTISRIMGISEGTIKSRFRLLRVKATKKFAVYSDNCKKAHEIAKNGGNEKEIEETARMLENAEILAKIIVGDRVPERLEKLEVYNTAIKKAYCLPFANVDNVTFCNYNWSVCTLYTVHAVTRTAHKVTPPEMSENRVKIHFGRIHAAATAAAAFVHTHKIMPPPLAVYTLNTSIVYRGTNAAAAADIHRRAADSTDVLRAFVTTDAATIA